MRRRIKRSVYYGIFAIVCAIIIIAVWKSNSKGKIIIEYVDQNGTTLRTSKKIIEPLHAISNVKAPHIDGYTPNVQSVSTQATATGANYKFIYTPDNVSAFNHIMNAKYIGVSAQNITINSDNGIQSVPFGQKNNRLRVLYADKMNNMKILNVNYPNIEIQDPKITKFGNYWFITYTGGVLRTADFFSWQLVSIGATNKYKQITAPSLIHDSDKLMMSFSSYDAKGNYDAYIAPFNYDTSKPNLKKALKLQGLHNVNAVDIYKGARKYYALYTKNKKGSGKIFIATAKKITGKYSTIRKITPPTGMYYYAPTFLQNQASKIIGIMYSSYYFNESNDLSYAHAFYRKGILGKGKATTINSKFALQKVSAIQIK